MGRGKQEYGTEMLKNRALSASVYFPKPFRNIRWNRNGGTPKLTGKSKAFVTRKCLRQSIDSERK